jgi:hypothetical protein
LTWRGKRDNSPKQGFQAQESRIIDELSQFATSSECDKKLEAISRWKDKDYRPQSLQFGFTGPPTVTLADVGATLPDGTLAVGKTIPAGAG